eukprot:TRINITY_DN1579_c0_g4_i1.p1 TRINITY_DN1579_c0_g4~~TRINITY_DN1579_c0_g4_i1.p1  ORF type:complete len:384 (-),score=89.57 TRINITY_DN1579_c0_g4_i1:164-1315(-)
MMRTHLLLFTILLSLVLLSAASKTYARKKTASVGTADTSTAGSFTFVSSKLFENVWKIAAALLAVSAVFKLVNMQAEPDEQPPTPHQHQQQQQRRPVARHLPMAAAPAEQLAADNDTVEVPATPVQQDTKAVTATTALPPANEISYAAASFEQQQQQQQQQEELPSQPHRFFTRLSSDDAEFIRLSHEFQRSWLKGARPKIRHILSVQMDTNAQRKFAQYRQRVALRRQKNECEVEEYRYHGTQARCLLADDRAACDTAQLCTRPGCGACGIVRGGFRLEAVKHIDREYSRFGVGHYFSCTASKSASYPQTLAIGGTRVLLVCQVVTGQAARLEHSEKTLREPPQGCDSVYAVPSGMFDDETVVYEDDAVLVRYLLVLDAGVV